MSNMENWKEIKGTEGRYFVSDFGNVKSKRKVLSMSFDGNGYLKVGYSIDSVKKTSLVHRLVAEAFVENPDGKPEVNHKNEVKTDNRALNLEWMTSKENMNYGSARERIIESLSLGVIQFDKKGNEVKRFKSGSEASCFGYSASAISEVCNGKRKTHKGFIWKFEK